MDFHFGTKKAHARVCVVVLVVVVVVAKAVVVFIILYIHDGGSAFSIHFVGEIQNRRARICKSFTRRERKRSTIVVCVAVIRVREVCSRGDRSVAIVVRKMAVQRRGIRPVCESREARSRWREIGTLCTLVKEGTDMVAVAVVHSGDHKKGREERERERKKRRDGYEEDEDEDED